MVQLPADHPPLAELDGPRTLAAAQALPKPRLQGSRERVATLGCSGLGRGGGGGGVFHQYLVSIPRRSFHLGTAQSGHVADAALRSRSSDVLAHLPDGCVLTRTQPSPPFC